MTTHAPITVCVTHYAERREANAYLARCMRSIIAHGAQMPYRVEIYDAFSTQECVDEVRQMMGDWADAGCIYVGIHVAHDFVTHNVLRNRIIADVETPLFVLLHSDTIVTAGWLDALVDGLQRSEARYGLPCAVSPLLLPYGEAEAAVYARRHNLPLGEDGQAASQRGDHTTLNGHQLMIYAAHRALFDRVGFYDEQLTAHDDVDMGMRVLEAGHPNCIHNRAYIRHKSNFSPLLRRRRDGWAGGHGGAFIAKWSQPVFDAVQSGAWWRRAWREWRPASEAAT